MLAPPSPPGTFPADTGAPPPDWAACYPGNGKLTPASYAKCNATQTAIIQGVRDAPAAAAAPALDHGTPHGACVDACPNQHCQAQGGPWCTSTTSPWRRQRRAGILTAPWRSTWTCAFPEIRRAGTVSSERASPFATTARTVVSANLTYHRSQSCQLSAVSCQLSVQMMPILHFTKEKQNKAKMRRRCPSRRALPAAVAPCRNPAALARCGS